MEDYLKIIICFSVILLLSIIIQMCIFINNKLLGICLSILVSPVIYLVYMVFHEIMYKQRDDELLLNIFKVITLQLFIVFPLLLSLLTPFKKPAQRRAKEHNINSDDEEALLQEKPKESEIYEPSITWRLFVGSLYFIIYLAGLIALNCLFCYMTDTSPNTPKQEFLAPNYNEQNRGGASTAWNGDTYANEVIFFITANYEKLCYFNIGLLIILSKVLFICYTTYGITETLHMILSRLGLSKDIKAEYNRLDNSFTKNFGTIKAIQSKKQQGMYISRKEREILNSCREKQAVLEHKQEVLEDKYSSFKIMLYYLSFPFKLLMLLCLMTLTATFIYIKGNMVYNDINTFDQKHIINRGLKPYSIPYLTDLQLAIMMIAFFFIGSITGMYYLGIFSRFLCFKNDSMQFEQASKCKILNLLTYMVGSILLMSCLVNGLDLVPMFSFYSNTHRLNGFGLFFVSLIRYFENFKIIDLLMNIVTIAVFVILSTYKICTGLWGSKQEDENIHIC
jgi:hypothetical protein